MAQGSPKTSSVKIYFEGVGEGREQKGWIRSVRVVMEQGGRGASGHRSSC